MLLRVTAEADAFTRTTETLAHNLSRKAVVERLGQKTTAQFLKSLDLLTLANKRNGVVTLTKKQIAQDAIAFAFVREHDRLKVSSDSMTVPTTYQLARLKSQGLFKTAEAVGVQLNSDGKPVHKITVKKVHGLTEWLEVPFKDAKVRSRPVVAQEASLDCVEGSMVMLHELAHAMQCMAHPAVTDTNPWGYMPNLEVEAYLFEAAYIKGLVDEGLVSGTEAVCRPPLQIQEVYEQYGSEEFPNRLTAQMRDKLAEQDLLGHIAH